MSNVDCSSSAPAALRSLLNAVKAGNIAPQALLSKQRLSQQAVLEHLQRRGVRTSWNPLIGNPASYGPLRALKFWAEGIDMPLADLARRYAGEIEEVRHAVRERPDVQTRSALFRSHTALYLRLVALPGSPVIFRRAGLDKGQHDYFYWTDGEILHGAQSYESWSQLKYADGQLHRHLKGRRLESELVRRKPRFARHFHVGLGGHQYRSTSELVVGNYVALSKVDKVSREKRTGLRRTASSRKDMVADFYFESQDLYLELAQNTEANRGSRREGYAAHHATKVMAYQAAGLKFLSIDTDALYEHGVLDVEALAGKVQQRLREHGIDLGPVPPAQALLWSDDSLKQEIFSLPRDALVQRLLSLGIRGIADLTNHYSSVLTCVRHRADGNEVIDAIRDHGLRHRGRQKKVQGPLMNSDQPGPDEG